MDSFDPSLLLLVVAAFLGVLSVGLLGVHDVFGISPTLKLIVFFLASLLFILTGVYVESPLDYFAYLLAVSLYLSGLYQMTFFGFDTAVYFAVTAAGSAFMVGASYLIQQDSREVSRGDFRLYSAVLMLSITAFFSYGMSAPEPTYTFIANEAPVVEGDAMELGKLSVHNPFLFSSRLDFPGYDVCMSGSEGVVLRVSAEVGGDERAVRGGEVRQFPVVADVGSELFDDFDFDNRSIGTASECVSGSEKRIWIVSSPGSQLEDASSENSYLFRFL